MRKFELIINRQKNRIEISTPLNTYTIPHVYVPKKIRNRPNSYVVKPNEQILVTWSHWNEEKGKKVEIKRSATIKQWKTLGEQKQWAKAMAEAYHLLLKEGFNPFDEEKASTAPAPSDPLLHDLKIALDSREGIIAAPTFQDYTRSYNYFSSWLKTTVHKNMLTTSDQLGHVLDLYFKKLRNDDTNPTYYNNQRANLSALFKQLVKRRLLLANPVAVIDKLKADPVKNKPFTDQQIKDNTKWMESNDLALLFFLRVMAYTFLRPKEIMRLKCGNIDFSRNLISVKTKSTKTEHVAMVPQLRELLIEKGVHQLASSFDLIHHSGTPQTWNATLAHKQRLFGKRFIKLREAMGYGELYTIYSYRHTMALKVYESFQNDGLNHDEILLKMKEVTRHKSIAGLKNYLRGIGAGVVSDFGHRISLDI
ncbi:tyrosine-type recombinase/integrase [Nonlabens xiamenensis]|uniref:tyrosine-type recombinase/integrase n=1 Tax=Nonlabens xiamenensis TaxID=2341043 RepID=UPI000F60D460|nr:tyrosine-type recombinase/integrase [Nonlabens xiamenensis]